MNVLRLPAILAVGFFGIYGYLVLATSYTGQAFDFPWYVAGIAILPWKILTDY